MTVPSARIASAREDLGDLMVAYLRGDAAARDRFPVAAHKVLTLLSTHHAWFLPKDLRAEIVNEAHLILLERPATFDPARAPARVFLRFVVRDAVKRVAASYCPPGWRTRMSNDEAEHQRSTVLSLETHAELGTDFADTRAEMVAYMRCDLRTVFDRAPWTLASALRRIYYQEEPMASVAESIGVSRFTLMRQIRAFAKTFQTREAEHVLAA